MFVILDAVYGMIMKVFLCTFKFRCRFLFSKTVSLTCSYALLFCYILGLES